MNDEARPNLEPIERMVDEMGVDAVFGEPIREGGVTVVPVAEVRFAFGYGYGSGRGSGEEAESGPRKEEGSGWQWRGRPGICQRLHSHLCR
jgi:uncharacterized spore protein YtfJ